MFICQWTVWLSSAAYVWWDAWICLTFRAHYSSEYFNERADNLIFYFATFQKLTKQKIPKPNKSSFSFLSLSCYVHFDVGHHVFMLCDQLNTLFDYAHVKTYDLLAVLFGNKHTIKIGRILYDMQMQSMCNHFRFVWGLVKSAQLIFVCFSLFLLFFLQFCIFLLMWDDLNGLLGNLIDFSQTIRLNSLFLQRFFKNSVFFSRTCISINRFWMNVRCNISKIHRFSMFSFITLLLYLIVFSILIFPCLVPNLFWWFFECLIWKGPNGGPVYTKSNVMAIRTKLGEQGDEKEFFFQRE